MPTILLTAWKIWQPVAAILAPALLALLIGVWISEHVQIASLNHQLVDANKVISGLRVQLSASQANAAQLRANGDALQKALDTQNASIADMQAATDAANARALTALRAQAASLVDAMNLAAQLEARKPQNGSYADLVGLLKGAAP